MDRRQRLIEIFDDTQRFYAQNAALAKALQDARKATKLYEADDYPAITKQADLEGTVAVSKHKTFEAAMLIHKEHDGLYQLHLKRAKHIMHIAASNGVDAMILGAFGCGAFANDPIIVSRAYRDAIADYKQFFHVIEFAVYCREDETENYDAFSAGIT